MNHSRSDVDACDMPPGRPAAGPPFVRGAKTYTGAAAAANEPCYAPVFEPSSALTCLLLSLLNLLLLLALIVVLIITLGNKAILCRIRQIQFRLKHCRKGNTDPGIPLGDPYAAHVHTFRVLYGKDQAWEQWMIANRNRYQEVFNRASARPGVLVIAFRYDTAPIAYDPPWTSEAEHMEALETFAELVYAGYNFQFIFNGNTTTSYANAVAGIPTNSSHASGKNVYLYYETIFNHEFGHVMGVWHHYDSVSDIGNGQHMPPGETKCLMDRNLSQYCSACRTALFIPLDVDNTAAISAAGDVIHSRYPY